METLSEKIDTPEDEEKSSNVFIAKKIWIWITAIFITFTTVLAIHPALTSQVVRYGFT